MAFGATASIHALVVQLDSIVHFPPESPSPASLDSFLLKGGLLV
jgi:hypothetical protein